MPFFLQNPDNNCILSSLSSKTSPGALKNAKELNKQSEYFSFDDCSSQSIVAAICFFIIDEHAVLISDFSKDKNPQKAATTVTPAITTRKLNNFSDDFNFLRNLIGATTKGGKFPAGQPLFGGGT